MSEHGNNAAMREALEQIRNDLWDLMGTSSESARSNMACDMSRKIRAAIAAPARNCDVFESEAERQAAFIDWYNETWDLKGSKDAIDYCDLKHDVDGIMHDYIEWLFKPAKPETKGDNYAQND